MSKSEILAELPKLTPDERYEIRVKLAELDGDRWLDDDDPLTDEQKLLLDARLANMEENPNASIPWDEAKKRIEARLAK
jgi:putative addiction module component (TIGR02574 family)